MKNLILTLGVFLTFLPFGKSQDLDSIDFDFAAFITLDSFVVVAEKSGFDVEDFIKMVKEDKTFYQAFRNIRTLSYSSKNNINLFDKKNTLTATYKSDTRQISDGTCRTMQYENEEVTGNYYKRKKDRQSYRYYTSKMYDRLFFTHGKKCISTNTNATPNKKKGMEKYVAELKKLIFQPGEATNIPFIGDKTAIFDKKMVKYYDYSISSQIYEDGTDCYVFTASVKDKYKNKKQKKTVIKHLETYFAKDNFQIVARNYSLSYHNAAIDMDVDMKIKLNQIGELYVPSFLSYDGSWNVPMKKPETAKFYCTFKYK